MGQGLELFCLTKNGEEKPVEVSLSPIVVAGETTAIVRIRDITKQLQHEKTLKIAKEEAEKANRTK